MFAENNYEPANVFRKIYTKRRNRKFLLCFTCWGLSKCSNRLQKIPTQYKHSLYDQLGIAKMFYSV